MAGDAAIVGAYQDAALGYRSGAAYVFARLGGVWTQQVKLAAADTDEGDWFGYASAIDGELAVVDAPRREAFPNYPGTAYGIDLSRPGAPVISSFSINSGATSTTERSVSLNSVFAAPPTECMASETWSFAGATWQPYSSSAEFTLSERSRTKTVYFKAKNANGESPIVSDTIDLILPARAGAEWRMLE